MKKISKFWNNLLRWITYYKEPLYDSEIKEGHCTHCDANNECKNFTCPCDINERLKVRI